jgi:Tannase-like family of unknown function (DUF6351)
MRGRLLAGVTLLATAVMAAPAAARDFDVDVLSSRADQVSGGDALVRVEGPRGRLDDARVLHNGNDVTDAFELDDGTLVGLVDGLRLGRNRISVYDGKHRVARAKLRNHPIEGPIFSGPHQRPFVCKTNQPAVGLGEPLVDNLQGDGFRVLAPDGSTAGWSRNCSVNTRVDWLYRSTAGGNLRPLPPGPLPADVASTTTLDGRTLPFIVRRERGTINRFIYSLAMLADPAAGDTDTSRWNRRLVYFFDGGVAIGRQQGTPGGSAINPDLLGRGYAIAHSSGTRTSVHYNMVLGGETALMTKERFVERYGVPLYTVGIGGSGGAIQQYLYGQNHPGLLDGAIPTHSYPDMVTQTIHIGDCELLERYMDVTDAANPKWQEWENREWLEGLNSSATFPNPFTGRPGNSECIVGWRGLTPLAMNPLFGTAGAGTERMDPAVMTAVHWTHWEDVKNVYGVGPDDYARQTWDNVGVQYGLKALTDGNITPPEFLHLNATVGSWKDPGEMVQEGPPFVPGGPPDPWSMRNQRLSADGGVTPAQRRTGSTAAMNAAYEEGLYFDGDIDIPIIDWRPYLEERLDMHNSHQSFASRRRMLDHDGRASNQVIWFSGPDGNQTLEAFRVMDEWLLSDHRPDDAIDRCFTSAGDEIARGSRVWDGILNSRPDGACTTAFPLHSTSRIVAGGPLRGGVYKCALQPVSRAIARGLYGSWTPTAAERERLEQIFPTGVCDYTKRDLGRPRKGV